MNIIIVVSGSLGDIKPFKAIGKMLLSKGFKVTIITNIQYKNELCNYGFNIIFVEELQEKYEYHIPKVFKNSKILGLVDSLNETLLKFEDIYIKPIYSVYRYISDNYIKEETIIISHFFAFGARLANEIIGIPILVISLSPYWLNILFDNFFSSCINTIRRQLGLKPINSIMRGWMLSTNLVIGLFPSWFGEIGTKMPENLKPVGFLYENNEPEKRLDAEIEDFISGKLICIVFRLSSYKLKAESFFHVSQKVCMKLGIKAIFITHHEDMLPESISSLMRCYRYVPFELLLKKVHLLVHDGGIGTCAEAIKAGIPQLICPRVDEQKDNAERLKQLGLCDVLNWNQYNEENLTKKINDVLKLNINTKYITYTEKIFSDINAIDSVYLETIKLIKTEEKNII